MTSAKEYKYKCGSTARVAPYFTPIPYPPSMPSTSQSADTAERRLLLLDEEHRRSRARHQRRDFDSAVEEWCSVCKYTSDFGLCEHLLKVPKPNDRARYQSVYERESEDSKFESLDSRYRLIRPDQNSNLEPRLSRPRRINSELDFLRQHFFNTEPGHCIPDTNLRGVRPFTLEPQGISVKSRDPWYLPPMSQDQFQHCEQQSSQQKCMGHQGVEFNETQQEPLFRFLSAHRRMSPDDLQLQMPQKAKSEEPKPRLSRLQRHMYQSELRDLRTQNDIAKEPGLQDPVSRSSRIQKSSSQNELQESKPLNAEMKKRMYKHPDSSLRNTLDSKPQPKGFFRLKKSKSLNSLENPDPRFMWDLYLKARSVINKRPTLMPRKLQRPKRQEPKLKYSLFNQDAPLDLRRQELSGQALSKSNDSRNRRKQATADISSEDVFDAGPSNQYRDDIGNWRYYNTHELVPIEEFRIAGGIKCGPRITSNAADSTLSKPTPTSTHGREATNSSQIATSSHTPPTQSEPNTDADTLPSDYYTRKAKSSPTQPPKSSRRQSSMSADSFPSECSRPQSSYPKLWTFADTLPSNYYTHRSKSSFSQPSKSSKRQYSKSTLSEPLKSPLPQPPKSPLSQSPKSPLSQPPKSPLSQPPKPPLSQPPKSPLPQPPKYPLPQPLKSPLSLPPKSPFSQPLKSPLPQPLKSPLSQSPKAPLSQSPEAPLFQPPKSPLSLSPKSALAQPSNSSHFQTTSNPSAAIQTDLQMSAARPSISLPVQTYSRFDAPSTSRAIYVPEAEEVSSTTDYKIPQDVWGRVLSEAYPPAPYRYRPKSPSSEPYSPPGGVTRFSPIPASRTLRTPPLLPSTPVPSPPESIDSGNEFDFFRDFYDSNNNN